jgi:hypothetical protein
MKKGDSYHRIVDEKCCPMVKKGRSENELQLQATRRVIEIMSTDEQCGSADATSSAHNRDSLDVYATTEVRSLYSHDLTRVQTIRRVPNYGVCKRKSK